MKAGLMEIADIFVINKSDRPGADLFEKNLSQMLAPAFHRQQHLIPIIKTIASEKKGISELIAAINGRKKQDPGNEKNILLLTEKAWQLIGNKRMKDINKLQLKQRIEEEMKDKKFNLYSFIENYK
jgi:LAO/AO transport system kinase